MGLFKKAADKLLRKRVNREVEKVLSKSNSSPEEKERIRQNFGTSYELVTDDFENNVISGFKVTAAFIVGMAGGPVGAFSAATTTAANESKKNQQKFVQGHIDAGIPISVNGKIINPEALYREPGPEQIDQLNYNAIATACAIGAFAIVTTAILLSGDDD